MGLSIGEIIAISLPLISFFDGGFVYLNSHFLIIVFLLAFYFYAYPMNPLRNKSIEELRKYSVLVSGSWLTIIIVG